MKESGQTFQRILIRPSDWHVQNDALIPSQACAPARNKRGTGHGGDNIEVVGFTFSYVTVDVIPYCGHLRAVLEVFRVVGRVVTDVLRCSTAQKGVLYTRAVGGMEVYDSLVDALIAEEVERETRVIVSAGMLAICQFFQGDRHT